MSLLLLVLTLVGLYLYELTLLYLVFMQGRAQAFSLNPIRP